MFMDLGCLSTPFFDICVHLSAPLVLVIFCNFSIRKLVFQRSEGIHFITFSGCFVDFVSRVVVLSDFIRYWMLFCFFFWGGVRLTPFFNKKKNCAEHSFKKGTPNMKTPPYEHVPGVPERPPRVRSSQTRNNSSILKCCSNLFPLPLFQEIV